MPHVLCVNGVASMNSNHITSAYVALHVAAQLELPIIFRAGF